ncbi:MAG: hypothetical protein PHX68_01425 [Alphaproteobacteria bacterium]|nr:hypothetical protein [Alphaproteobacteria bacterium]
MTPLENKCLHEARRLHADVAYGGGRTMLDQVMETALLINLCTDLSIEDRETAICAALLHKCFEPKRIVQGAAPLTEGDVRRLAGDKVLSVVRELMTEPEDKTKSKRDQWAEKAQWAKGLSQPAREILLAEKIVNFTTSRDRPNPSKPPEWHLEYFDTRMLMVEALKDTNNTLYRIACQMKAHGVCAVSIMQAARARSNDGR